MATSKNNTELIFTSGSADFLAPDDSGRRYAPIEPDTKCAGHGCAYAPVCGRFVRKEVPNQQWASFYAMADDDCQYFESLKPAEATNA